MFKRLKRREKRKTDYRQRLALLKSGKTRVVVRRALNNIHVQFIEYGKDGDKTLTETMSKHLKKYEWKFHGGNLPSSYLTGLLAGLKAKKKNINETVLDLGLQTSIRGTTIYAVTLGIKHSGILIPMGDISPSYERISGKHIVEYAKKLKSENKKEYEKRFSSYLKNNTDPEKLPENFEEVKKKIAEEFNIKPESIKTAEKIVEE